MIVVLDLVLMVHSSFLPKASFRYRSTDEVVREYPVDTAANEDGSESQPFIEESKCHSPTTAPTHTIKKD